ncbi:MAG: IS110 family transposase [Phenylobacterium sp.]|uniref:IS110 family transposase n=1 Tax=Phenylobacterium sp. TaxID=1871053 RepID=UPI0027328B84|nr:IS110 family transposase [Phenylobacterium sp.]MDP3746098.1 IS110 family transposase [Phenylobacterium sp.]
MSQEIAHVGVDVAKTMLDVSVLGQPKTWRASNSAAGWRTLIARLGALERPVVVGVEPSGGYERGLVRALIEAGLEVRWADPARVRALARALGAPAKTDAIDAALIARFVAQTQGRPVELDDERQRLKDLLAARQAAGRVARQLTAQAQALDHAPARAALEGLAAAAAMEARELTRQALAQLRDNPDLKAIWTRLQTAPGVGPLVAAELVAHMPELGRVGGKAIAKLAGLAPFIRKSGAWTGRAVCSGGRARPRQALYMAAVASLRAKLGPRPVFQRLVQAGKPTKLALTACMRRLLVTLNAMIRDNTDWRHAPA